MRCPNCGKEVQDGFLVCPDCSEMLPINDDTNTNNYNSGTYASPSYTDVGNNYNRKTPKKLKLYILIILVAFSVIAYSVTAKNGTYEYKGDAGTVTLKLGINKYTLTKKVREGGKKREWICSGKIKFAGSTGTLTIDENEADFDGAKIIYEFDHLEIKCKYNRFKKTITLEMPVEFSAGKYTLKKKKWFG